MNNEEFTRFIRQKGEELYRTMPWREDTRPYYVLVSELMLQQTQVERVIPKFNQFIQAFPDEHVLATASLSEVLMHWQGLGYNRRAKFLHESARRAISGFPNNQEELVKFPGVGKNTAGAIMAYSFNTPVLFIETNIRTVYLHHFFGENELVDDRAIMEKLGDTLDQAHPRTFYWALMDYGSWLKANGVRNIAQSKHYKKQSALAGSVRQVRGQIIRELANGDSDTETLMATLKANDRFATALEGLIRDGLIESAGGKIHLTK